MTKKRLTNGFTIVEIAIVVFIIAILATLTLIVYNNVQMQARDTKRANDVRVLMVSLESYYSKNGEYPFSCSYGAVTNCATSNSNYQASLGVPPLSTLSGDTTPAMLQALIPGVGTSFGDPTKGTANPINVAASSGYIKKNSYLFLSPNLYGLGGSVLLNTSDDGSTSISCGFSALGNGQPHYYVVGYFSEAQSKWVFYKGPSNNGIADLRWNYDNKPVCNLSSS